MRLILAVDAGGTSTRAAVFDRLGRCLGVGRAGAGNPTSAGIDGAVAAIANAAEGALSSADDLDGVAGSSAAIAFAGEETDAFHDAVSIRLAPLGVEQVTVASDLLGMFHSGTPALDGYVLIAGTGTIAARVVDGRLARIVGGAGWLLGDAGSGFWVGHRVVRAVVADVDGHGETTRLTPLLLDELGIDDSAELDRGSPRSSRRLVSVLYAMRPVELARFAPLAFAAVGDATAERIVVEAAAALESLLGAVRGEAVPSAADPSPVVVGGSILIEGMRLGHDPSSMADRRSLFDGVPTVPVSDGLLGAAVIGFGASAATVDDTLFDRLRTSLALRRRSG